MDGLPKSYPIQFINEPLYKINIANYIELDSNKKYISMDMIDMADIIAYEFINRDLGEDHASIEKLLEQCGLIGYEDASLLINKFKADGDEMYKLSQQMFVGETTYLEADVDRNLIDYFYTKKFSMGDKTTYRDVVNYSCRYANNIVANSIVSNCGAIGINLRPISVAPTYIDFILTEKQGSTVNIDRDIMDKISIHAFGRKFIVTPKLTII